MTDEINRRDFMKRAAFTTAGVSLSMAGFSTTNVLGANDRIRLGVIGTGRQGTDDMQNFMQHGVEVAAVCDVYQPNLDKGLAAGRRQRPKPSRIFARSWTIRTLMWSWSPHRTTGIRCPWWKPARQARTFTWKSPSAWPWKKARRWWRRRAQYNRVVQVGLWQRSNLHFQKAVELVQSGVLGKVSFVRTWNYGNIFPDRPGNLSLIPIRRPGSIGTCGWAPRPRFLTIFSASAWPTIAGPPSVTSMIMPTVGRATGASI